VLAALEARLDELRHELLDAARHLAGARVLAARLYGVGPLTATDGHGRVRAVAERWISSARRECLDGMVITAERDLQLVVTEYVDHYNSHRPHRSLPQSPPAGRPHPPALDANVRVLRRDRLAGLVHEYSQVA
jgi:hypothetical protein